MHQSDGQVVKKRHQKVIDKENPEQKDDPLCLSSFDFMKSNPSETHQGVRTYYGKMRQNFESLDLNYTHVDLQEKEIHANDF